MNVPVPYNSLHTVERICRWRPGIILCTDKDETVVKYSVLKENKQLFASKYKLYLPSEKELIEEIEREKAMIVREREAKYGS